MLATQNPVDLDYKALSNAGTWFLGRLQTERDKAPVLDGLEGIGTAAFDRRTVEATLSGLDSRVFLMNNVHEDAPVVFRTRWAMSYLRGPLTRAQIRTLMDPVKAARAGVDSAAPPPRRTLPAAAAPAVAAPRPALPPGIDERFLRAERASAPGDRLVYRPALLGSAKLHFVSTRHALDLWDDACLLAPPDRAVDGDPWAEAAPFAASELGNLDDAGDDTAEYGALPPAALDVRSYARWARSLAEHLYRSRTVRVLECKALGAVSAAGAAEGEFRVQLRQAAREARDLELEKLRRRYAPKLARLEERIRSARQRVERERSQYSQQKMQTAISLGATLLGALLGRKAASAGTVGRATSTAHGVGRISRERGDVERAEETLASLQPRLAELERRFEDEAAALQAAYDVDALALEERTFRPRKSDLAAGPVRLVWTPFGVDGDGRAEPLFT